MTVEGGRTDRCRSCHAPVFWRRHERTDRPAPIDATPVEGGNVELVGARLYRLSPATPVDPATGERLDEARYVLHFATCPKAKEHRRR